MCVAVSVVCERAKVDLAAREIKGWRLIMVGEVRKPYSEGMKRVTVVEREAAVMRASWAAHEVGDSMFRVEIMVVMPWVVNVVAVEDGLV